VRLSPFGHQLVSGVPQAWAELLGRPVRQVTTCRPRYKGSSSQLRRLDVSLESGGRLAVLVKFTNSCEARVYRDLAAHLPLNVPLAYYTEGSLCILEALPPAKPITAWSEQDERLVLGDLARMHASFWCSPELDNYPWLTCLQDELNERLDKAERGLRLMREVGGWPGLITPHTLEVMDALLADRARLLRPLADLPLTLIHCDTWQPNWVLLDDRRILLDWQSAARGPAVWDVTYFLEMSGEAGGRLPLEESQALNAYWDALAGALHDSLQSFADDRMRHEFWAAVPAVSVISTLTRWPMYAVDYLRPVERFPALARVWKGLPHGLRRRIEAGIIWTDLEYYRQVFARFEERARTVYGV
jgi:hypothetical protein